MTAIANVNTGLPEETPPPGRQVAAVLLGCGAIGFFLGMVWQPSWQDALEPAQVLAGVVSYPPQNPVFLYSTRVWTALHQVLAVLLYAGFSERALALVLSGVIGMVSLQALGVFVFALSRDIPLAILSPFFIVFADAAWGGVTYPVYLVGAPFTYGVIGLSYMTLTFALIGVGQARWGALLLGFGPAVHPAIGAWAIATVAVALIVSPRRTRQSLRDTWSCFLAGAGVAVLSAIAHYVRTDSVQAAGYLSALVQHWDEHRQPFPLLSGRAVATYFSATLPALWLWRFRGDVPQHARVLLRILVVAAVLGGTFSLSYWIVPATVPNVIPALMPSRLLNLGIVTCMALLIGLSSRYGRNVGIQSSLATLVVFLTSIAWMAPSDEGTNRAMLAWACMAVFGVGLTIAAERRRIGIGSRDRSRPLTWLRRATIGTLTIALLGVIVDASSGFSRTLQQGLMDRTSDPLLATTAARPGLLLTASNLHMIQLFTRRPVLLDGGALDMLIHAPEAAPETDRILQRVYGTSLLSVQQSRIGWLPESTAKALWETRAPEEWQQMAREFGVTDVLTYGGWTLQLPVVASNTELTLYAIPAGR